MRNFLALVGGATLTVLAVGWYLGWYSIASSPEGEPGKKSFQVDVDTEKIHADGREIGGTIRDLIVRKETAGSQEPAELVGPRPEMVGPMPEMVGPPAPKPGD